MKRLGLSDAAFGEMLAVIALFNKTNKLADAMQVEPDVKPKT